MKFIVNLETLVAILETLRRGSTFSTVQTFCTGKQNHQDKSTHWLLLFYYVCNKNIL